ncbi:MAG TPA: phosphonate ABC transporter, permease protein PhnE [Candidatus Tectomicrobia bacterium]
MNPNPPACTSTNPVASGHSQWEARRTYSALVVVAIIALIIWSAIGTGADFRVFLHGDAWFQMARFVEGLFPPDLSSKFLRTTFWSGVETLALSLMGTVLAVLIALPLGILSGRTVLGGVNTNADIRLSPSARLLHAVSYWGSTLGLNLLRSIPELFWALIFILAVGLGPFAGVLALGFHTGGVLGKLFSEVIEDVNPQPIEALQATGASTAAVLAYGIFPLALPQLISYTLYRWEVNIRAAAIIGVVGAGGIGREIYVAVSLFHYHQLLTLLLMTLIIVTLVDYLSTWIRTLQRV